jgi:sensor histidine kinase regulating citrate/malate metabolism
MLLFVYWSFAILCFAIVNTHEKSKQKYEVEIAKEIIASGQNHYEKMNDLLTTLRIMRHDSKYHHNVVLEFLHRGDTDKAIEYLSGQQAELSKHEFINFCDNQVINALLIHYAQRCKELYVDFTFKVAIPKKLTIPDYDMCIIVGNLLENALEASQKLRENRKIMLVMKTHNEQLILRVENNFIGETEQDDSINRKNSGLGLRSVSLVTDHYNGKILINQDDNVFTVSILIELILAKSI